MFHWKFIISFVIIGVSQVVIGVGNTITVNIHYPEVRVDTNMLFVVGYGPLDGPTGSLYDQTGNFAASRIAQKTGSNMWSVALTNVIANNGQRMQFTVFALDYRLMNWDETMPIPASPVGQDRSFDCMLNHDVQSGLFISRADHNSTLVFTASNRATLNFFPYFCAPGYSFSTVTDVGGAGFAPREINVGIPYSMIENYLLRTAPVIYLLDGAPATLATLTPALAAVTWAHGREYIAVGVRTVNRGYELVPFSSLTTSSWIDYCGFDPCYNSSMGGGAMLASFIRGPVETAVMVIARQYITSISYRALMGFSYGGLAAFYIATRQTKMFDQYIVGSPSFWFNKDPQWTALGPISQFPSTKRLLLFNCMPEDATDGMASDAIALSNVYKISGGFVNGVNFMYGQVWPTVHSLHCGNQAIYDLTSWILSDNV